MAGSAYPHIIFAKTDETLPKGELEALLRNLLASHEPPPITSAGVIDVKLALGSYAFSFWYDDEAEGMGSRYADYAPTIKHRRISRATTMIDFSGEDDPSGEHAQTAQTIAQALAELPDVYVFSEETKSFVGMDYEDPFAAPPAPTAPSVGAAEPEPAAAQAESTAAEPVAVPEAEEPATVGSVVEPEPEVAEEFVPVAEPQEEQTPQPVVPGTVPSATEAAPQSTPAVSEDPEPVAEDVPAVTEPEPEVVPVVEPEPDTVPVLEDKPETGAPEPVTPIGQVPSEAPAPEPAPEPAVEEHPAVVVPPNPEQPAADAEFEPVGLEKAEEAAGQPTQPPAEAERPAQPEEQEEPQDEKKPGFFKRLFGRR